MLHEMCQLAFNAREVCVRLRSDEEQNSLIALADSVRDTLDIIRFLAGSAAQKIGSAPGNYFHDTIEWMMPPIYRARRSDVTREQTIAYRDSVRM